MSLPSARSTLQYLAALAIGINCSGGSTTEPAASVTEFAEHLESLRGSARIPAITAVISKDQSVAWSKGFGLADMATQRPAADTTVYHLASLTKPFAATVILQLVEEGKVSLDDPASNYGIVLPSSGTIRIRHLLSHTSEGVPGTAYSYSGDRFGLLDSVIVRAAGKSVAAAIQERIVEPLGLKRTAANPQTTSFAASGLDKTAYLANFARGYTFSNGTHAPTNYPTYFGTAAGLTSSALDVAAFSMAMDRDALLKPATKAMAFAPAVNPTGQVLPYGLGWFSTDYKGVRVIWHYGYWTANSSLIIKVPDRGLTFVLLANTDGLSSPYPLGSGKLETSPWAREFLETFVIAKVALP